jgi:hypothetical protein
MSLNNNQTQVLDTLIQIMDYHNTSIDGKIYPEAVFSAFVSKYLFFNDAGDVTGYVNAKDGLSTSNFEETVFFNHVCSYLRGQDNKTYIIDNQIRLLFKMLSIPFVFNHFDPRIYSYAS